jgi:hypothetical protein
MGLSSKQTNKQVNKQKFTAEPDSDNSPKGMGNNYDNFKQ